MGRDISLCYSTARWLVQWKEHFKELLNQNPFQLIKYPVVLIHSCKYQPLLSAWHTKGSSCWHGTTWMFPKRKPCSWLLYATQPLSGRASTLSTNFFSNFWNWKFQWQWYWKYWTIIIIIIIILPMYVIYTSVWQVNIPDCTLEDLHTVQAKQILLFVILPAGHNQGVKMEYKSF